MVRLVRVDKAPRLSISIVIWILASDICQLNQFNTNSEAAMLSTANYDVVFLIIWAIRITPNKTFHITSQTLRSHKLEDMFNDLQKAKVVYYRKGAQSKTY